MPPLETEKNLLSKKVFTIKIQILVYLKQGKQGDKPYFLNI